MKSEVLGTLATSPLLLLPLVALFLFLGIFLGIFILTMRKKAQAYDPIARLPLDNDGEES